MKGLMDPGRVQYFKGMAGSNPLWTPHLQEAGHVVEMHKSFLISCCFVKPLGRYLLFNSFDWRNGEPFRSDLQVWDAPFPWGPWRKVKHWINWGEGNVYPSAFYWNVDPATISGDGRRMVLVFSGAGKLDAYHSVEIELLVNG